MKNDIKILKTADISSDVFVIAPSQIESISNAFGDAVAEAMNIKPLAPKIRQIASDILIKTLHSAKNMGE